MILGQSLSGTVGRYRAVSTKAISCCEGGYRLCCQVSQPSALTWQPASGLLFLAETIGDAAEGLRGGIRCEIVDGHRHAVAG